MQQTKQNGIDADCSGRMTRSHGLKSRPQCHPITQQKTAHLFGRAVLLILRFIRLWLL